MKSFRIVISLAVTGLLALGLSGCGDKVVSDTAAPVKSGVDQIHKADGAVDKLNGQIDQSEGVIKQFKK